MKELEEREKLKKQYAESYCQFLNNNPDCPVRGNYNNKKEYRIAKDKWNGENSDISDYIKRRYEYLKDRQPSLAILYIVNHQRVFNKEVEVKHEQLNLI